jgi:EAL domain-containing protein (putative c-di-GMP-specific phosphodiesterase class I)
MTKPHRILCIDPEPSGLRIGALLNRRGIAAELTEATSRDAVVHALSQPEDWDLLLCDVANLDRLAVTSTLTPVQSRLDGALVLVKAADDPTRPRQAFQRGASDLVVRDDLEHLLTVCERELVNCAMRRELRALRAGRPPSDATPSVMVATITDLSRGARAHRAEPGVVEMPAVRSATSAGEAGEGERARIRAFIESGGLTLEFQPIISLRGDEEHRSMFETLVRLKDDAGNLLLPGDFLPIVAGAGWMGKIDLWILRRALSTLQEIQEVGNGHTVLFINLANETLRSEKIVDAIGAHVSASNVAPGSVVFEVRRSSLTDSRSALGRLAALIRRKHHGLLLEDAGVDDCSVLQEHRDLITHIKLDRLTMQALVERRLDHDAVTDLVDCAHREGMRVIALAVDNAELLPLLFASGVDAMQGHFVSMPYQSLVYPSIQRVESIETPGWQAGRSSF